MRIIIFLTAIALFSGCAGTYQQASYVSRKAYIGMPILEFQKIVRKKAKLAVMEDGYTVYRMNDYDFWTGVVLDTRFYYFDSDDELYKIDGGELMQNRYQLEILDGRG